MSAQPGRQWLPPLRGGDAADVAHFTTACRASALVLTREGHPRQAQILQDAASTASAAAMVPDVTIDVSTDSVRAAPAVAKPQALELGEAIARGADFDTQPSTEHVAELLSAGEGSTTAAVTSARPGRWWSTAIIARPNLLGARRRSTRAGRRLGRRR